MGARNVETQCLLITDGGAEQCKAQISTKYHTDRPDKRYGINVVQAKNPASVAFPEVVNIPWGNQTCVNHELTMFNGAVTTSPIAWNQWKRTTTAGKGCSRDLWVWTATLQQAIIRCDEPKCFGISWDKPEGANDDDVFTGLHLFRGCRSAETADSASRVHFSKDTAPPAEETPSNVVKISFQPEALDVTLPAGFIADTGAVFSNQNGRQYGWTCTPRLRPFSNEASFQEPTYTNTYAENIHTACTGGVEQRWEIVVPNGAYRVKTIHNRPLNSGTTRMGGCNIENTKIYDRDFVQNVEDINVELTRVVEVNDGRLTLSGKSVYYDRSLCGFISTLELERIAPSLAPSWLPSARNPWWQQKLNSRMGVKLVTVKLPTFNAAAWRWFWLDNTVNNVRPAGFVEGANRGAVVAISDTPCTGTTCTPKHTCQVVTGLEVCYQERLRNRMCDVQVDCGEVRGEYLYVQLPGQRVWSPLDVQVNFVPRLSENDYICYGVEARTQTETSPEYVVTTDPEDPIFYSTCWVREKNITWLPPHKKVDVPSKTWKFNGQCLDCSAFNNSLMSANSTTMDYVRWSVSGICEDCDRSVSAESVVFAAPSTSGTSGGAIAGIMFGVLLAIAVVVLIGFFVYRKRGSAGLSSSWASKTTTPSYDATMLMNPTYEVTFCLSIALLTLLYSLVSKNLPSVAPSPFDQLLSSQCARPPPQWLCLRLLHLMLLCTPTPPPQLQRYPSARVMNWKLSMTALTAGVTCDWLTGDKA